MAPVEAPLHTSKSEETKANGGDNTQEDNTQEPAAEVDFTAIPAELDRQYEALNEDHVLRPTIITTGDRWGLIRQTGLLSKPKKSSLHANEQAEKKAEAFDLLDALSRSGELEFEHASLHVVIAATHCFDQSLVDTVIRGNANPIEKVEQSMLIVAGVIHRAEVGELLRNCE